MNPTHPIRRFAAVLAGVAAAVVAAALGTTAAPRPSGQTPCRPQTLLARPCWPDPCWPGP